MSRTPLLFLIAFVASLAGARTAAAGRVVVLAVQGDPEGELEDALISIVEERHDLVTSGEFERAARKSGLEDMDGPSIGKVARKLGAEAVVEGAMSREDEGFLLVVRVRGTDGKTAKKITVDLNKPRLSAKAKKRLGSGVLDGIDAVLGLAGEQRFDDDGDEPKKSKKSKKKSKQEKRARRDDEDEDDEADSDDGDGGDDGDDDEGEDDEDGDDDDRVAARDRDDDDDDELSVRAGNDDGVKGPVLRGRAAIILEVGPSAKARTLSFTSRPDFEQAPTGYKSPLVPGVRVAGEAYPLAFKDKTGKSPAAGLGLGFEFDQTLKLISRSSDAPEIALPTLQRNWEVSGKFRYAISKKPIAPTITLGMGYGRRAFIVDRAALPEDTRLDMPDVDYRFYAPSLAVRVPFGDRAAIHATGKALLFQAAGAIQSMDSYGGAKITGFDASAGIEVRVARQILIDVSGSMTQIGFVFAGNGAETVNRDLDPSSVDVGGAADKYLGVVGSVGWAY